MTNRRWTVPALVVVALTSAAPAAARTPERPSAPQAVVARLIQDANAARIVSLRGLFTSNPVLHVGKRTWRGARSVDGWWQGQIAHHVHLSLVGSVVQHGAVLSARVHRLTRGGDCARGCDEQGGWTFSGTRIAGMILMPATGPVTPPPVPRITVPPPPTGPPSPHVTPTIPT